MRDILDAQPPAMAMETARLLTKHGAFSDNAAGSLLRSLALSSLADCADTDQLAHMWAKLTEGETLHPEVARAAARRWLELGGEPGRALQWLMPQWQDWLQQPDALDVADRGPQDLKSIAGLLGVSMQRVQQIASVPGVEARIVCIHRP